MKNITKKYLDNASEIESELTKIFCSRFKPLMDFLSKDRIADQPELAVFAVLSAFCYKNRNVPKYEGEDSSRRMSQFASKYLCIIESDDGISEDQLGEMAEEISELARTYIN